MSTFSPDVSTILAAVRSGRWTARDVIDESLARIAGDETNAVITVDPAGARAAAAQVDRAIAHGVDPGPLAGVPFTAKDTVAVGGLRATAGSRLFARHVAARDAAAVARLRDAGAVIVGKTNCPEFALQPRTDNDLFGPTTHPLDPTRSPGGSSGGCAAAVAGGLVPFSIGGDYGGSIRYPAACTGIYGLRPARTSVPTDGHVPEPATGTPRSHFQTFGPLARTPADVAAVFGVMSGRGRETLAAEAGVARVGFVQGGWPVAAVVDDAMSSTADSLRAAGFVVDAVDPSLFVSASDLFDAWRATDDYADLRMLAAGREGDLTRHIARRLAQPPCPMPAGLDRDVDGVRARMDDVLAATPVVCLPVARVGVLRIDDTTVEIAGAHESIDALQILAPSRAVSLLGVPALAVPAGTDADGFPTGVQLIARPGREAALFEVAARLHEVSTPALGDAPRPARELDQ